jgi:tRNA threonylcarbamoyladenosine biosynthesis protein TsaE
MLIERAPSDLEGTRALGERLGRALRPGDFIGISGPLGAGKTTLIQAIGAGAQVALGEVTSPTFTLVHRYRGATLELQHVDFYRIDSLAELHAIGFFELLGPDSAVLVEWIDRFPSAAPEEWLELRLTPAGSEARRLEAWGHGPRGGELLQSL